MIDDIDRLGGIRPAARVLGVPVSTVANWKKNGIPDWRRGAIERALGAMGARR
jgi:hypothetical protein